jgi:hypothetical protein
MQGLQQPGAHAGVRGERLECARLREDGMG